MLRRSARALRQFRRADGAQNSQAVVLGPTRRFSTQNELSRYLLRRAKAVQVVARSVLAYPRLSELNDEAPAATKLFTPNSSLRERMFMLLLTLVPPDEPLDIPEFLVGAKQAAQTVCPLLYSLSDDGESSSSNSTLLLNVASPAAVKVWDSKNEALKKILDLPERAIVSLTGLKVTDAALAEVEYAFSTAAEDQEAKSTSIFRLNEAMRVRVRFSMTERLMVSVPDLEAEPIEHTVHTTFDWRFDSNVSRANLVDWYIAKASPFKTEKTVSRGEVATPTD